MDRTILYYPAIEIPSEGTWLRQALLYWDKVGSIVPRSYDDYRDEIAIQRYSPDINFLYDEGLFRPFNPDDLILRNSGIVSNVYDDFKKEFLSVLRSKHFLKNIPAKGKRGFPEQLFKQKISKSLISYLKNEDLAEERKKTRDDNYCYYLETQTYRLYMSLLAKHLAKANKVFTQTGTDEEYYFDSNYSTFNSEGENGTVCFSAILRDILPTPAEGTSLKKILKFKKDNRRQLLEFRGKLDDFQTTIKNFAKDSEEIKRQVAKFSDLIEKDAEKLASSLRKSFIPMIVGSLQALFTANVSALVGTLAIYQSNATSLSNLPLPWVAAGVVASGTVGVASHLLKTKLENFQYNNEAFAYLYLAEKKLGVKKKSL